MASSFIQLVPTGKPAAKVAGAGGGLLHATSTVDSITGQTPNQTVTKSVGPRSMMPLELDFDLPLPSSVSHLLTVTNGRLATPLTGVLSLFESSAPPALELTVKDAKLARVTLPRLSRQPDAPVARARLSLQPTVSTLACPGVQVAATIPAPLSLASTDRFALAIDGLNCAPVFAIEEFSVSQRLVPLQPADPLSALDIPDLPACGPLTVRLPAAGAADWVAWHRKTLDYGQSDKRKGTLSLLDTLKGAPVLARVTFDRLGLLELRYEFSTTAILVATLFVESARLELARSS